jgi:hypothetical protein
MKLVRNDRFAVAAAVLSSFSVNTIGPPNMSLLAELIELRSPAGVLLPTVCISNVQKCDFATKKQ